MNRKQYKDSKIIIAQQINPMFYQQDPVKIQRTFVLEDEATSHTKVIPFEILLYKEQADLFPIFSYALSELKNIQIKIYDFNLNKYVDIATLGLRYHVPAALFSTSNNVILIKYNHMQAQTLSFNSVPSENPFDARSDTHSKKTQRSKQRVILEVIQIVKKWRKLCDSKRGASMTLAEAASLVGLPKKSLDDYYYQLRMGQKYGFDYHGHIFQRIGTLRSFLKKYKTHRKGDKNQKLPNQLNIAEQVDGYENMIKQNSLCNFQNANKINEQEIYHQNHQEEGTMKKQDLEKDFYNEFNYSMGKDLDPFLSLERNGQNMINEEQDFNNDFQFFF